MYIKNEGMWRNAVPYAKHGNVWKEVKKIYYRKDNIWYTAFEQLNIFRNIRYTDKRYTFAQAADLTKRFFVRGMCLHGNSLYVAANDDTSGIMYIYKINSTTFNTEYRLTFTYGLIKSIQVIDDLIHVFGEKIAYKYTPSLTYTGGSYAHGLTSFDAQDFIHSESENCNYVIAKNPNNKDFYTNINKTHAEIGTIYNQNMYNILPHASSLIDIKRILMDSSGCIYMVYLCGDCNGGTHEIAKFEQY